MSLQTLILSLVGDITDPKVRLDIASTIRFLADLYLDRKINEDQLRSDLYDVIGAVVDLKHPELFGEEKKKKIDDLVDQFVRVIRIESIRFRMLRLRGYSPTM